MPKAIPKWRNPAKIHELPPDAILGWRALAMLLLDDYYWRKYYLDTKHPVKTERDLRISDINHARYLTKAEAKKEAAHRYYLKNRERILKKNKRKYWLNPEKARKKLRDYRKRKL